MPVSPISIYDYGVRKIEATCLHLENRTHLHCLPSRCHVLYVEGLCLLLKLSSDNQYMVFHHIEFVQQQGVRWGQVLHPQRFVIWQERVVVRLANLTKSTACFQLLLTMHCADWTF